MDRLEQTNKNSWEITFEDNTIAPVEYYKYWTLVQYCLDIKEMSYHQLLSDTTSELKIQDEMTNWYDKKKANAGQAVLQ